MSGPRMICAGPSVECASPSRTGDAKAGVVLVRRADGIYPAG
jgi:hypothetical protein